MAKMTNAEVIKLMVELNDKYAEEHPNEEKLLKPQVEQYLKAVLAEGKAHGNNPKITNLLFNDGLKAKPINNGGK